VGVGPDPTPPVPLEFIVVALGALLVVDVAYTYIRRALDHPPPPRRWDDSPHTAGRLEASLDRTDTGKRVRLIRCSDPYTKLTPGEEGTISFADDMGTVHVRWDSGSSLGLVPGEDAWTVLDG